MLDLQKATLSKRISAFLFDLIIFFIVVVGVGCIVNPIVGYDAKVQELEAIYNEYSERYGIDTEITQEQFNQMTKEEQDAYNARVEEANAALNEDVEALELYHSIIVLLLFNVTVSTLVAYLALEFAIPLLLGNGQTIGKKIFGVALMRADGVKITPMQVFVRSILGKFTLETMIPVLVIGMIITKVLGIVGIIVLLAIVALEVFAYVKSGTNSLIHDVVAVTVCIDLQSQLIFETEEELIEHKKKLAAENAGRIGYGGESASSVYSSSDKAVEIDDETSSKIYKEDDESDSLPALTLSTISIGDETYVNTASAVPQVEDEDTAPEEAPEAETEEAVEEMVDETAEETTEEEATEEADGEETEEPSEEEEAEIAEDIEDIEETEETETPEAEDTAEENTEE